MVLPVPFSTAEISRLSDIRGRVDTLSFKEVVSSKAGETVSCGFVEGVTEGTHGGADSV